mgnify:CR=1 FL=1
MITKTNSFFKNNFHYEIKETAYSFELIAVNHPEFIHIKGMPTTFYNLPKFQYSKYSEVLNIYNTYINSNGLVEINLDDTNAKLPTTFKIQIPDTHYTLFYAINKVLQLDEKQKFSSLYTIYFGIINSFVYENNANRQLNIIDLLYETFKAAPMAILSFDSFDATVVMRLNLD